MNSLLLVHTLFHHTHTHTLPTHIGAQTHCESGPMLNHCHRSINSRVPCDGGRHRLPPSPPPFPVISLFLRPSLSFPPPPPLPRPLRPLPHVTCILRPGVTLKDTQSAGRSTSDDSICSFYIILFFTIKTIIVIKDSI